MKQLSTRFFTPIVSFYLLALRLTYFSSRSANRIVSTPQRLVGKWRLYLNYCPECNSCEPKLHHCDVCKADTKAYFAWNKSVEQTWWKRYAEKHHIAA